MDGEPTRWNRLLADHLGNQTFSERRLVPVGKQPTNEMAPKDVQEDRARKEDPLRGAFQLDDIPTQTGLDLDIR